MTTANIIDRTGALRAVDRCQEALSEMKVVLADSAYTGEPFAQGITEKIGATLKLAKRCE